MVELIGEATAELLAVVLTSFGAAVLTAGGFLIEQAGVHNLLAGQSTLGAWEIGMGAVVIFAGVYLLGYKQAYQRLRSTSAAA